MPEKIDEKRKSPRFRSQDDVYAAFRNGKYKVGLVRDISWGGVAFEYIEDDDSHTVDGLIDIFVPNKKFYLRNVPCKVVYKNLVPRDSISIQFISFILVRCGVQFSDLDEVQHSDLKQLMQEQT